MWEGIKYNLPEETIKQNIIAMDKIPEKGSVVSFDFFTKQWLLGKNTFVMKYAASRLKDTDEPFQFGFDGSSEEAANQQIKIEFLANTVFTVKKI